MTYIEYIKNFWQVHDEYSLSVTETALYFYLLEVNNICLWKKSFNRNNSKVLADLGISSFKTLSNARNRLKDVGLIDFKTTNGSASVIYTLGKNTKVRDEVRDEVSVKVYTKVRDELNKTKTKTKTIDNSNELFPEPKKKKTPSRKKEIIAPSLSEVKEYFSGKLEDWEQEAETFFYHFDSLGWRTANGARIERWDSRANLWIHEKLMRNGNRHTENNGGNSITVTDTNKTKQANSANTIAADLAEFIDSIPIG